jgi:hypothetical protein
LHGLEHLELGLQFKITETGDDLPFIRIKDETLNLSLFVAAQNHAK